MLEKETKIQIKARINNGLDLLTPETKILFAAWESRFHVNTGRARARFTKTDLIAVYTEIANLYRAQQNVVAEQKFDFATMSFADKSRYRARQIKAATTSVRDLIASNAPIDVISNAKNKVKAAIAWRPEAN